MQQNSEEVSFQFRIQPHTKQQPFAIWVDANKFTQAVRFQDLDSFVQYLRSLTSDGTEGKGIK
jgi:hypothetical protein